MSLQRGGLDRLAPAFAACQGQAATETLVITVALVLVAGLVSWGDGGLLGLWLDALELGFARFAAALAVPV